MRPLSKNKARRLYTLSFTASPKSNGYNRIVNIQARCNFQADVCNTDDGHSLISGTIYPIIRRRFPAQINATTLA